MIYSAVFTFSSGISFTILSVNLVWYQFTILFYTLSLLVQYPTVQSASANAFMREPKTVLFVYRVPRIVIMMASKHGQDHGTLSEDGDNRGMRREKERTETA